MPSSCIAFPLKWEVLIYNRIDICKETARNLPGNIDRKQGEGEGFQIVLNSDKVCLDLSYVKSISQTFQFLTTLVFDFSDSSYFSTKDLKNCIRYLSVNAETRLRISSITGSDFDT